MSAPLKIFIIYAREDRGYKDDLLKSLNLLQTQGLIEPWHDSDIKPGDEWDKEIKDHLRAADIILPIISFDFFDSDYIHRVEIVEAFERYDRGEALIIPIIADACPWTDYPRLKDFQALPAEGKPIDDWSDRKKAMSSIYGGVKRAILPTKEYATEGQKEDKEEAKRFVELGLKEKDLLRRIELYSQALQFDPKNARAYNNRGWAKYLLARYEESLMDCNNAIQINPNYSNAYHTRGAVKEKLGLLGDARNDFLKALSINPKHSPAQKDLQALEERMKK